MKKVPKVFATAAMLLVLIAAAVRGQSALDGFDPNADQPVVVVVVQPDGKILLGGPFTALSPNGGMAVTRNSIARLNPDGTLDTAFDPNPSSAVNAIAAQADGKILVGGVFNNIGGQFRNRIARLDATTGLADSFDPDAGGPLGASVLSIAVQADGKILVGGRFTSIGGQTRNHIARLNPDGTLDAAFDPNPIETLDGEIRSIVVQADGKILIGGVFTSMGGLKTRKHLARLNPDGTLDTAFDPNPSEESYVNAIVVQADGKILVGGPFNGANSIGGQTRNYIARLDATTGLADSFNPNANNEVHSIAVQADGKILVGGDFNGPNSIGGQTCNWIARLNMEGVIDATFNPNPNSPVHSIAVQADGKVLAGGVFTMLAPNGGAAVTRNHVARLETDGRLDQTLNLNVAGVFIAATAVQRDGKILIGGVFTSVLGAPRNNIARLNTDGTLDTAFNPNANQIVNSIVVQEDGKILAGGSFTNIGGQTRNRIARLDPTTGLADSFDPNPDNDVLSIAMQADGKILAGGYFTNIGGQTRRRIARLDPTTGLADSFNPNVAEFGVFSIAVQADGKILAGGTFRGANSIGGQRRNYIARLNATTGTADSFNPNANNGVNSIAVQADGRILVGGVFTFIGERTRNRIARVDATTGIADSFDPNPDNGVLSIAVQADGKILASGYFTHMGNASRNGIARLNHFAGSVDSFNPNANNSVGSIALQADGKILAGGNFTNIGGQPRNLFARLPNDVAAVQELAVTQTSVAWIRGGSSSQLGRVTFESSSDSVNYAPLGNGIPQSGSSDWTLTGLNLPTGQNFYIRARGYYRAGEFNVSESITESVRNAFLAGPTPTPTPTPTPSTTPTPNPTLTPTPTPATIGISGTVLYCSNPVPGPVPNVTLNLTGDTVTSTLSDGSGNYQFSSLEPGNYTVTPTKPARPTGTGNITGVDAVAVQRHFLNLGTPLSGCELAAADVTGDSVVDGVDALAIQRFFLGLSTGIANTGKYKFVPVNRAYPGIVTNQSAQNYDTLVFGDVVSPFAE